MLFLGRGFAYIHTGEEKLGIPPKLIKIRFDRRPPEDFLTRRQLSLDNVPGPES